MSDGNANCGVAGRRPFVLKLDWESLTLHMRLWVLSKLSEASLIVEPLEFYAKPLQSFLRSGYPLAAEENREAGR